MDLSDEVNDAKLLALASERMVKADPAMFVPAEHLYASNKLEAGLLAGSRKRSEESCRKLTVAGR